MGLTLAELIVVPLVVLTTLFGLLARGNPRPGGVALFLRVGLAGLVLAGALYYLVEKTAVLAGRPSSRSTSTGGSAAGARSWSRWRCSGWSSRSSVERR